MNVLSLFDGMSCGQVALKQAGIKVSAYYSSEINKHANKVTKDNFPNTIQLGDITKCQGWFGQGLDLSTIDLILAGSPCQGFSSLGKHQKLKHEGSRLFFAFVDILKEVSRLNPSVKFMLENVLMDKFSENTITTMLGVSPVKINSITHSACSRPRNYWANFQINQPLEKNITFEDCVDYNSTESNLSEGWNAWWKKNSGRQLAKQYSKIVLPGEKGICLVARQYSCWAGNFIQTPDGFLRKPNKKELAALVGAPNEYFRSVSQRQAEEMTGNGWDIRTISHILECMKLNEPNKSEIQLDLFGEAA